MKASKSTKRPARASAPTRHTVRQMDDVWVQNPERVHRFLRLRPDYEQLCTEVAYILRKRVEDLHVETASISSRAKTLNSFLEKLQRKSYLNPFEDITDFAGARVVCLYHSDIAKVGEIIHSEFEVIEDVNKLDELAVNEFGYGARHFIVRLGKASSGARYDDLKSLFCEIQVRTVVQDAWAIIQHHMVYKRETQVPRHLQRKLNSLAGLFETVDDQFERIREDREAYLVGVRDSVSKPATFLDNELNFDSFKEYLKWRFPESDTLETWDGQIREVLDGLLLAGCQKLKDVDKLVVASESKREAVRTELRFVEMGLASSCAEVILAFGLVVPNWRKIMPLHDSAAEVIERHRADSKKAG